MVFFIILHTSIKLRSDDNVRFVSKMWGMASDSFFYARVQACRNVPHSFSLSGSVEFSADARHGLLCAHQKSCDGVFQS